MKFTYLLAMSAFAGTVNASADGLLCVAQDLIDVFDAINSVRGEMTDAATYTKLSTNSDSWDASTRTYWETQDTSQEAILSGQSYLTAAVAAVADMTAAIDDMTWAEGLALATQSVATDYLATGNTSVTGTDGSTTNTRANQYGTWSGGIVEYIFEIEITTALAATDIVQALLINDGDSSTVARNAIVSSEYTRIGLSITNNASDATKYLVDVVFAKQYTNSASVTECQVTREFGGDICDPTDYEK